MRKRFYDFFTDIEGDYVHLVAVKNPEEAIALRDELNGIIGKPLYHCEERILDEAGEDMLLESAKPALHNACAERNKANQNAVDLKCKIVSLHKIRLELEHSELTKGYAEEWHIDDEIEMLRVELAEQVAEYEAAKERISSLDTRIKEIEEKQRAEYEARITKARKRKGFEV